MTKATLKIDEAGVGVFRKCADLTLHSGGRTYIVEVEMEKSGGSFVARSFSHEQDHNVELKEPLRGNESSIGLTEKEAVLKELIQLYKVIS